MKTHDHVENDSAVEPLLYEQDGKVYFRSAEQLAGDEALAAFMVREFPEAASELTSDVSRRNFLSLMGAGIALAGFGTGCVRRPEEKIVPYAKRPEDVLPGLPNFYATAMPLAGAASGLVVEAHDGRPTKIEGNPLHPASLGAACSLEQGSVLDLYDPDRLPAPEQAGAAATWADFDAYLATRLGALRGNGGQGLFVLHQALASPTFSFLVARLAAALPNATVLEWEAVSDDEVHAGTRLAFGEALEPLYRVENADVILSADADFLSAGPMRLRYAREWASRRVPEPSNRRGMSRLYAVESVYSTTGGVADHRLRVRPDEIGAFLRALAGALAQQGVAVPAGLAAGGDAGFDPKFVTAVAEDLASRRGRSLVVVGRRQPAAVQALGHALNAALGAAGTTVVYVRAAHAPAVPHKEAIRRLAGALDAGQVDTLVVLGGNPAYDAPVDLGLADKLGKAKNKIHLTGSKNETSVGFDWVVPEAHFLEAWGDVTAADGTVSVIQPLIQPLWDGRSPIELVAQLAGEKAKGYDLVRSRFRAGASEDAFRKALHDGVVAGSSATPVAANLDAGAVAGAVAAIARPAPASAQDLVVEFLVDGKVFDGRFANNAWLQELPDPMTKLTWTNALLLAPKTAKELGVKTRDMVRIEADGRTLDAAVWIQPGTAEGTAAIALGYGRRQAGRIGKNRGYDAYKLRGSASPWYVRGKASKIAGEALLASTQDHHFIEGRPIVREGALETYKQNPDFAQEMVKHPPLISLYKDHAYTGQQWGMAIDLNACVGCNGCMIACQAENNIPVVGPEQVQKGREMHWIRLDRYFVGHADDPAAQDEPAVIHQPMTCQQCENAPCETVCPVAATVHSKEDGLNDMVYNRCIGTRYCSNNCPWKVRRFNFLNFHERNVGKITEVAKLRFNPDVTVRTRGVMEKCTYCVQRIHAARRDAKVSGDGRIKDGVVTPACAQACPTQAIVFGDINDPNTKVARLKKNPRNYATLAELNTRPRTSYLARIRNPNPKLA